MDSSCQQAAPVGEEMKDACRRQRDSEAAMDQYPLKVAIPRADASGGKFGYFRHTEYVIEIDDCGRIYPLRARRFRDFLWLHQQLRLKELACVLPELPPKQVFGRLDNAFVDRRRRMLEDYLKALLRIPAVVLDCNIWCFLDADTATIAVPRYLCRTEKPEAAAEHLSTLRTHVIEAREHNEVFRMCNPVITKDLTAFVQTESDDALVIPGVVTALGRTTAQARLHIRVRLCMILQPLLMHSSGRTQVAQQGFIDAGLFGSLIALLKRATDDADLVAEWASQDAGLCRDFLSMLNKTQKGIRVCLEAFVEGSEGAVLLHFCQHNGGLEGLQELVTTSKMDTVTAGILWNGMKYDGVVAALTTRTAGGLPLLGHLADSNDLKAKILAALSIGCVVRHAGLLSDEDSQQCFDKIFAVSVPMALDAEDAAAVERATAAEIGSVPETVGNSLIPIPGSSFGPTTQVRTNSKKPTVPPGSRRQSTDVRTRLRLNAEVMPQTNQLGLLEQVTPRREPNLACLIERLCKPDNISRFCLLLEVGGGDCPCVDSLSHLVVGILDHATRQIQDPVRLKALLPLVPHLQELANVDPNTVDEERAPLFEDIVVRVARILLCLFRPSCGGDGGTQEPPGFQKCCSRARVLAIITQATGVGHDVASSRIEDARSGNDLQAGRVKLSGLDDQLCLPPGKIHEFGESLAKLMRIRGDIGREVYNSAQAAEAVVRALHKRGINQDMFQASVIKLHESMRELSQEENTYQSALARLRETETVVADTRRELETVQLTLREVEMEMKLGSTRADEASSEAAALSSCEAELAEICFSAPANLERLRAKLLEIERKRVTLTEKVVQVSIEVDRSERWADDLREQESEADQALHNMQVAASKLKLFRETLNNDIVLNADETETLKALEVRPTKPCRLRRVAQINPEDTGSGEVGTPCWNAELKVEKAFREDPQFRTMETLINQRLKLWDEERTWVQDISGRAQAALGDLKLQKQEQETLVRMTLQEEEQIRREMAVVDDAERHKARHDKAVLDAANAHQKAQEFTTEYAEAVGRQKSVELRSEQLTEALGTADQELKLTKQAADAAEQSCKRFRAGFEKRCLELEEKARQHLQGTQVLESHECALRILESKVSKCIEVEALHRAELQADTIRLIEELTMLDQQLNCEPLSDLPQSEL